MRPWLFLTFALAASTIGSSARAQCTAAGDACDDGEFCTVSDACDSALECVGTPRDCRDGVECTDDVCNESTDACDHPPDPMGTSCSDGEYCTVNDECDGMGACAPGAARDCDDGLSCTSDTCDEANDECDASIRSGRCLIGGTCRSDGDTNPSSPCEICSPGDSSGSWSPGPPGTVCGASSCATGQETRRVCDDAGACVDATSPCEFGACHDENFCATCRVDDDCPRSSYCRGTECVLAAPNGALCDRDWRCQSGHCVEGICCDDLCDGSCESCMSAASPGLCTPYPVGTDPDDACGMTTCDGSGGCGGDAGVDASGEGNVAAHGSGCIACTVRGRRSEPASGLIVLFLTAGLTILRRRRRR